MRLLLLAFVTLSFATGCITYSAPVMPPSAALFANISAPIDTDAEATPVSSKTGEASVTSVLGLFSFGDASTDTAARNGGCIGAIVHGAVRDVAQMNRMRFAVFASGTCVYDSMNRQRVVAYDVPVEIDGVAFAPGDLVLADVDGVVVVPQTVEQQAIGRAWQKVHAENVTRDAINFRCPSSPIGSKSI